MESIRNYISGVKTMFFFLGIKFPEENLFQIDLVFKGLARIKNKAQPSTPHDPTDFEGNLYLFGYV